MGRINYRKVLASTIALAMTQILVFGPAMAWAQTKACGGECAPYFMFSKIMGGDSGKMQSEMAGGATNTFLKPSPSTSGSASPGVSASPSGGSCGGKPFPLNYNQVGPMCEAIKISESAVRINTRVVAVFAASATTCAVMCALTSSVIGALATTTVMAWVCPGAAIVASVNDLYGLNELKTEAKMAVSGMSAVSSAVGVGTAGIMGLAAGGVGGLAVGAGTSVVGPTGQVTSDPTGCRAAIALFAVTAAKYSSLAQQKKTITSNCKSIKDQWTQSPNSAGIDPNSCKPSDALAPGTGGAAQLPGGRGAGQRSASGAKSGLSNGSADGATGAADDNMFDENAIRDAATAGFKDGNTKALKDSIDNAKQNGLDIDGIANKIEAGMSPSEAIAAVGVPGIDKDLIGKELAAMKKMEDLALGGSLYKDAAVQGTAYAGGGGGAPKAPAHNMMAFGSKAPAVSGTEKKSEVAFQDSKKSELTPGDLGTNVWHPYWTGTIFDLVSKRTEYSRSRVEQIEWASPVNKALSGSNLGIKIPVYTNTGVPATDSGESMGSVVAPGGTVGKGKSGAPGTFADPTSEVK